MKATGTFSLDGFVKGTYNDKTYPAFGINTSIINSTFQYPKLPMGASDINARINVGLATNNYDDFKVDVPKFHIKLGNNPFDAVFYLRTPVSDPNLDMKANGILNLQKCLCH